MATVSEAHVDFSACGFKPSHTDCHHITRDCSSPPPPPRPVLYIIPKTNITNVLPPIVILSVLQTGSSIQPCNTSQPEAAREAEWGGGGGVERGERRRGGSERRGGKMTLHSPPPLPFPPCGHRETISSTVRHTHTSIPPKCGAQACDQGWATRSAVCAYNTSKTESLALGLNENRLTSAGVHVPCILHARR